MALSQAALANAPRVTIGDREFAIPEMGAREVPKIAALVDKMQLGENGQSVSGEAVEALYEIVYVGLTRASPELSRADFDDLPLSLPLALAIFPTIARACGLEQGAPAPGEGKAVRARSKR